MPRLLMPLVALGCLTLGACAAADVRHTGARHVARALADPSGRPNLAIAQPVGGRCLSSGATADIRCPVHEVDGEYLGQLTDPQAP